MSEQPINSGEIQIDDLVVGPFMVREYRATIATQAAQIEALTKVLYEIDGATMSQFRDYKHMAEWIKQTVRNALYNTGKK